jgi:hypothetical protein
MPNAKEWKTGSFERDFAISSHAALHFGNCLPRIRKDVRKTKASWMARTLRLGKQTLTGDRSMILTRKTTGRRYVGPTVPRSDKRYENPTLLLILDRRCVHTIDWSFGGIKISGVHDDFPLGHEVKGQIVNGVADLKEDDIHFVAKVIRCDRFQNATRLSFVMLTDTAFKCLERVLVRREPSAA